MTAHALCGRSEFGRQLECWSVKTEIPERQRVRPKFVVGLIIVFLIPTLLFSFTPPSNLLNTVGVLIPFGWLSVRCFRTQQIDFAGLVSVSEARCIWIPSLVIGVLAYRFVGADACIAWFISAGAFSLYEPAIHNLLVLFGIIIPRERQGYKSFD